MLGDTMLAPLPKSYTNPCPRCGVEIPTVCKYCWSCGKVLDPHIIEPAKTIKEVEVDE